MRRPSLLALGLVASLVAGLAGCVTPSIPIPPPDPTAMTFTVQTDQMGTVTSASLTYPPTENYVGGVTYVYNRTLGVGIIQDVNADGSIGPTTPVAAQLGNSLVITIANEEELGTTCVLLKEGTPSAYCP